jgi:hypothetical protein
VELEQGSAGFLTAVRSMKFEDDRFLKETVERIESICGRVRGPRGSDSDNLIRGLQPGIYEPVCSRDHRHHLELS